MSMKIITYLLFVFIIAVHAQTSSKAGHCPLRDSVRTCMPRCISDYECSFDKKCCPNICGSESCASSSVINTGNDGGYKGSYDDRTVYCNGLKCRKYEKCQYDRKTRREKCVRA